MGGKSNFVGAANARILCVDDGNAPDYARTLIDWLCFLVSYTCDGPEYKSCHK